jgi:hypothetical protein
MLVGRSVPPFTGMRDLRESNNLQKRSNSGIEMVKIHHYPTLKQSIKLISAGITTISIIFKGIP